MERGIDDRAMPPGGEVSGTDRAVSPVADVAMAESALDVEELLPHSPAELRSAAISAGGQPSELGNDDKLADALASLKREATELEGCWGDDKLGVKFAKSYIPFAEQTLNNAHPRAPAGPAAWGPSWNSSRARS
jgi:hypothetical protein